MSKIELKVCPFCGAKPNVRVQPESWGYHEGSVEVQCKCGASAGSVYGADKKREAAEKWNARAPQWQPIESAPKDGTRILLFGDGDQVVAYFNVGYGTWDDGDHHDDIQGLTHWQPLSAPPEVEG